jgi:hypothetical protein
VGVIFSLALVAGSACGASTSTSSSHLPSSPNASGSRAGANLDPGVSIPKGFPSDFPVYAGARLTSAANFGSNGTPTWGMEWETVDGVDLVQAFYKAQLAKGDWTLSFPSNTSGKFSATFNRKSNTKVGGILGIDASSGITKISLALTSGA